MHLSGEKRAVAVGVGLRLIELDPPHPTAAAAAPDARKRGTAGAHNHTAWFIRPRRGVARVGGMHDNLRTDTEVV